MKRKDRELLEQLNNNLVDIHDILFWIAALFTIGGIVTLIIWATKV